MLKEIGLLNSFKIKIKTLDNSYFSSIMNWKSFLN